jgi:hypothetical protein
VVALVDDSVGGDLKAKWRIANDGWIYHSEDAPFVPAYAWITPQSGMELYECRATATSLEWPPLGEQYNVWLDLAQSWTWGWGAVATLHAGHSGSFLLEIRRKSDLVVVASCNVDIAASGAGGGTF